MKNKKPLYGVGINDLDTPTQIETSTTDPLTKKRLRKVTWRCPFYGRWANVLERCYSGIYKAKEPSYTDAEVVDEWKYLSGFKAWMVEQDWQGKELDKDLLFPGNKLYGPETCIFIDKRINRFMIEHKKSGNDLPVGVSYKRDIQKYEAYCSEILTSKKINLGLYDTPQQAHNAWLECKLYQAKILASEIEDDTIAKAFVARYENYKGVI